MLAKTRYTRHELEMYIGVENVDDFDVDAIEQEVSTWDVGLGCSVWTVEGEELSRACYRHQRSHDTKLGETFADALESGACDGYERVELIALLGDYVDEYDVQAIEHEATYVDMLGRRRWLVDDDELVQIIEKHHVLCGA